MRTTTARHPMRNWALTLFQPAGTGIRIALVTGRAARRTAIDWVRLPDADTDEVVSAAVALGGGRDAFAVVTGAPDLPPGSVSGVMAGCLAAAGFEELAPGREIAWPAAALAAE